MKYNYVTLYNKNANFFKGKPRTKKALFLFNDFAVYLFALAYVFLIVYGAKWGKFAPEDFVNIFCAPALTLILVSVLRLAIERPRPFDEAGAGITPLKKKSGKDSSFPSRHLASASVIASIFLPYFPALSALLFLFSVGLGYARFAIGWHYPSDLFVGFVLGLAVGLLPIIL